LLERVGLPVEIKLAKEKEAKLLKKSLKKQKEAVKFELKYKKVKFTGKQIQKLTDQFRETKDHSQIREGQ
jgi:hypothetical protein